MSSAAFDWRTTHILGPVVNNVYSRSPVNAVQVRDDRLLIAFSDATIRLFDRASGIRLWTLEGHTGPVNCLHSSKTRMVTGADDKTIRVWDMREGRSLLTLDGHIAPVLCVRLSDRHVLSGGRDHTIKVWDKSTGVCLRTLRGHTGRIVDLQLSPGSGSQFFTSSTDGTIKLWDVRSENRLRSFKGHKKAIVAFHYDGENLVSAADDASIKAWDSGTGKCMSTLRVGSEREVPRSLRIRNDLLFCGEASGTIRIREASTGTAVRLLEGHASAVSALQVEDYEIWSGSADSTVRRWSTEDEVRVLLERMKTEEFEIVEPNALSSNTQSAADHSGASPAPALPSASSLLPATPARGGNTTVGSLQPSPFAAAASGSTLLGAPGGTLADALQGTTVEPAWATGEYTVTDVSHGDAPILCCALSDGAVAYGTEDGRIVVLFYSGAPDAVAQSATIECASPVRAVFLSDGRIGAGADDGSVALWALGPSGGQQPTLAWTVSHHSSAISALKSSGSLVVSASLDATLVVSELATGVLVHRLAEHAAAVTAVHFLGTTVVSGAADGNLAIWDAEAGTAMKILTGHRSGVTALEFDDLEVLSASEDGCIRVWDVATGECVRMYSLGEGEARINCLQFDDSKIVHGLASGDIVVRDMETGDRVRVLAGHTESVTDLAYSANVVVSASRDASLRVWTFVGAARARGDGGDGPRSGGDVVAAAVPAAAARPPVDDAVVASESSGRARDGESSWEAVVGGWSSGSVKRRTINRGKNSTIAGVALDDGVLVSGGSDGVAKVWDIGTGTRVKTFRGHLGGVNALALNGDMLVTGDDLQIRLWSMETSSCVATLDGHEGPILALGYNDTVVVSGSRDHTLKVWDAETGRLVRTLKGHNGRITDLVLAGSVIVSASTDGSLKLWDINSSQRVRSFKGHTLAVNCCDVVHNRVVSGSSDGSVRVWDIGSGNGLAEFAPSSSSDITLCLKADDHKIVCGTRDGSIAVRRLSDGHVVRTWDQHSRAVNAVAFDNTRIVSGSDDKTLKVVEFFADDAGGVQGKNKSCVLS